MLILEIYVIIHTVCALLAAGFMAWTDYNYKPTKSFLAMTLLSVLGVLLGPIMVPFVMCEAFRCAVRESGK